MTITQHQKKLANSFKVRKSPIRFRLFPVLTNECITEKKSREQKEITELFPSKVYEKRKHFSRD